MATRKPPKTPARLTRTRREPPRAPLAAGGYGSERPGPVSDRTSVPEWLIRLLIRDGPDCHLCGLCIDIQVASNYGLSASRDHLIPNPLTRRSGRRKREIRAQKHPVNLPGNIRLMHRFCNSLRGQKDITDELRQYAIARVAELYPKSKFNALEQVYAMWRSRLEMSLEEQLEASGKRFSRSRLAHFKARHLEIRRWLDAK
jgi:hypothetical protein